MNQHPTNTKQSGVSEIALSFPGGWPKNQLLTVAQGNFMAEFGFLEMLVRTLMIRSEMDGRPLHEIYSPDRNSLVKRVRNVLKRYNEALATAIEEQSRHRNRIVHGVQMAIGGADGANFVILPQDTAAALVAHLSRIEWVEESVENVDVIFPTPYGKGYLYSVDGGPVPEPFDAFPGIQNISISAVTAETRELTLQMQATLSKIELVKSL